MRKIRILALALLMVFVLGTVAQAVEDIRLEVITVRDDGDFDGILQVIGSSGYTDSGDMNFTAKTENGDLEIVGAAALRNEGTSWFVILENGWDNSNDNLKNAAQDLMKGIADMVMDIDEGALILSDGNTVNPEVQKASSFRNTLGTTQGRTDYTFLPDTLNSVMRYIVDHRSSLMPNVAVVVLTQARLFNDEQMEQMEKTMAVPAYHNITTHVVCPIAKTSYDNKDEWLTRANRVAKLGKGSLFGTGNVIAISGSANGTVINSALNEIRDRERELIVLWIAPENMNSELLGKRLTVSQTTSGGKTMTTTVDVSEIYDAWKERVEAHGVQPIPTSHIVPAVSAYTIYTTTEETSSSSSNGGISTELIIGIALGVVIIALVVVLLLVNKSKKTKKTASTAYGVASGGSSSRGSASSGTQVSLRGDDGSSYTGTLRNNRLIIGRDSRKGAQLAISNDGKLSGVHVILEKQGNQMMVIDQNSMNGTKVNGNRISGPTVLNQNGTLGIGSHTYTVTWRG